jgi:chromosome segregation ATPase
LTKEGIDSKNGGDEIKTLQENLSSRRNEIKTMLKTISTLEEELNKQRQKCAESDSKSKEKSASFDSVERENDLLRSERDDQCKAFARIESDMEKLRATNDTLSSERDEHVSIMENTRSRLTQFQSWTENAQQRISDLEAEKDSAHMTILSLEKERTLAEGKLLIMKEEREIREKEDDKGSNELDMMGFTITNPLAALFGIRIVEVVFVIEAYCVNKVWLQ